MFSESVQKKPDAIEKSDDQGVLMHNLDAVISSWTVATGRRGGYKGFFFINQLFLLL